MHRRSVRAGGDSERRARCTGARGRPTLHRALARGPAPARRPYGLGPGDVRARGPRPSLRSVGPGRYGGRRAHGHRPQSKHRALGRAEPGLRWRAPDLFALGPCPRGPHMARTGRFRAPRAGAAPRIARRAAQAVPVAAARRHQSPARRRPDRAAGLARTAHAGGGAGNRAYRLSGRPAPHRPFRGRHAGRRAAGDDGHGPDSGRAPRRRARHPHDRSRAAIRLVPNVRSARRPRVRTDRGRRPRAVHRASAPTGPVDDPRISRKTGRKWRRARSRRTSRSRSRGG
jgi:hypothetical protein